MKLKNIIKIFSPNIYFKWQTLPKFEWGPLPGVFENNPSMKADLKVNDDCIQFAETLIADPS
jgi:hypothetical protein